MDWYQLDTKDVFEKLGASREGLSGGEVERRLSEYGLNKLVEAEKISKLRLLLHQFTSPLIYILLAAGLVTTILGEYVDSGVIAAVVVLNAVIGFIQEHKAEKSVRALKKMVVARARVIRDGREKEIDSEQLVPGDIVLLTSGVKVPADVRLFQVLELRIEEAMLTGESVPAEKSHPALSEENLIPGDQTNMGFMGTIVVSGRGKGIVVGTGDNTALGKISLEVKDVGQVKAPIIDKINAFARNIGLLVGAASILVFFAAFLAGEDLEQMFMTAVAAAVATIPEGLPIVVTVTLAIGVSRMADQNAIVRKLHAVETLGSTTVIGSDKTGTLTKNEMTVILAYDGTDVFEFTGTGYEPEGELLHDETPVKVEDHENLKQVLRIGLLCNESDVYEEDGEYRLDGDPTEGALVVSAIKAGIDLEREREDFPQIGLIPFESERGYMATLHEQGERKVVFVKGSVERLLDKCENCATRDDLSGEINRIVDAFAREGLRVLAMGFKEVANDVEEITHGDIEDGLVFAGLQGMIDPPREEARQAIRKCGQAGIRTVMITGDHAITAQAIAQDLGIGSHEQVEVLTGKDLETMDDEDLFGKVQDVSVYARVSPAHKLRIVQQLKNHGEIVAVTGDGVNDAPALKAAHIGVAMGRTGTDVAKEAADMVITDDNFASIFNAVREGRVVYDNIKKVIFFLIPTGIAAVLSIIGALMLGLPVPYVPAQLLWINLVTNGLQDVALAFEPGEKGIIDRPPRDPREGIMTSLLIQRIALVGIAISVGVIFNYRAALNSGDSIEQARTVAVTTMVFFQFFQAYNARSELGSIFRINPMSNLFLFFGMIAAFFAQLAVLYVPVFQRIFRTVPLAAPEWLEVILVSITIIVIVEIDKWIRRKSKK